ncbi:MAG: universal stress protein [Rhodothermales bacterium]|nr:universal stress protein [Rhodothermales bacterium]
MPAPYPRILVARDFSACSERALHTALDLAERTGAEVHLLYAEVLHSDPFSERQEQATPVEELRRRVRQDGGGQPVGAEREVEIRTAVVRDIAAAPAIVRYAEEHGVDLIVMGTHGRRGVRRLLLGSVAEEVLAAAPCAVLTVREGDDPGAVEAVLVPVDFSEPSRRAIRRGQEMAALYGAALHLVHVFEAAPYPSFYGEEVISRREVPPHFAEEAEAQLRRMVEAESDAADGGAADGVTFGVMAGQPFRQIAAYARDHGVGLIVMGTRGLSGLQQVLLGSTAERTIRTAPCPVLVVKKTVRPDASAAPAETAAAAPS